MQRRVASDQLPSLRVVTERGCLLRCPFLQGMSLAAGGRLAPSPFQRQRDPQMNVYRPWAVLKSELLEPVNRGVEAIYCLNSNEIRFKQLTSFTVQQCW